MYTHVPLLPMRIKFRIRFSRELQFSINQSEIVNQRLLILLALYAHILNDMNNNVTLVFHNTYYKKESPLQKLKQFKIRELQLRG